MGPLKQMLVVIGSPVGTCRMTLPLGLTTVMQLLRNVATQRLPFASSAIESKRW